MSKNKTPVMHVFAGNNGSGKSTIRNLLMDTMGLGIVIDPDALARTIDAENPEKVRLSAGKSVIRIVNDCIKQRYDFCIETTLAGGNVIRQMQAAKQAGYMINMFFVGLIDVELNIERVAARVQQGGHHIDEEDIRRRHSRSIENLLSALELIDRVVVVDNSYNEGRTVMEIDRGQIVSVEEDIPDWVQRLHDEVVGQS